MKPNELRSSQTEVMLAGSMLRHVEDLGGEEINALPGILRSGEAKLRVIQYPWGVEFDLLDGGGSE